MLQPTCCLRAPREQAHRRRSAWIEPFAQPAAALSQTSPPPSSMRPLTRSASTHASLRCSGAPVRGSAGQCLRLSDHHHRCLMMFSKTASISDSGRRGQPLLRSRRQGDPRPAMAGHVRLGFQVTIPGSTLRQRLAPAFRASLTRLRAAGTADPADLRQSRTRWSSITPPANVSESVDRTTRSGTLRVVERPAAPAASAQAKTNRRPARGTSRADLRPAPSIPPNRPRSAVSSLVTRAGSPCSVLAACCHRLGHSAARRDRGTAPTHNSGRAFPRHLAELSGRAHWRLARLARLGLAHMSEDVGLGMPGGTVRLRLASWPACPAAPELPEPLVSDHAASCPRMRRLAARCSLLVGRGRGSPGARLGQRPCNLAWGPGIGARHVLRPLNSAPCAPPTPPFHLHWPRDSTYSGRRHRDGTTSSSTGHGEEPTAGWHRDERQGAQGSERVPAFWANRVQRPPRCPEIRRALGRWAGPPSAVGCLPATVARRDAECILGAGPSRTPERSLQAAGRLSTGHRAPAPGKSPAPCDGRCRPAWPADCLAGLAGQTWVALARAPRRRRNGTQHDPGPSARAARSKRRGDMHCGLWCCWGRRGRERQWRWCRTLKGLSVKRNVLRSREGAGRGSAGMLPWTHFPCPAGVAGVGSISSLGREQGSRGRPGRLSITSA